MIKRSSSSLYENTRSGGVIAVGLNEGDELVSVRLTYDTNHILLVTSNGMAIRFSCQDVRASGRSAHGVRGIAVKGNDSVVSAVVLREDENNTEFLTVSSQGFGKRTNIELYRLQARGGKGVINFRVTNKTGTVIGACPIRDCDSLVLMTSTNKIIRIGAQGIRSIGRIAMGVTLVKLDAGAHLVAFDRIKEDEQNLTDKEENAPLPLK